MAHAHLLDKIQAFIARYVYVPDEVRLVLAIWTLHTWLFDAFQVTPYLYVNSPKGGSGKTRLLETLGMLVRNPRRADDMTISVMIRLIDNERSCILLDEADTKWSGSRNEPLRQTLSSGYKLGGVAQRELAREVREYSVFSPKVLCGINNGCMPATVLQRCIPVPMEPKPTDVHCDRFRHHEVANGAELEAIMDAVDAFIAEYYVDVTAQRPEPMGGLTDRQDEISEPLLMIANVLGVEGQVRDALYRMFAGGTSTTTPEKTIFTKIHAAFDGGPKIWTEQLCDALGVSYSGRQLALWLEPFGIEPKDVRMGQRVKKGYTFDQFVQVFRTYVGPELHIVDTEEIAA